MIPLVKAKIKGSPDIRKQLSMANSIGRRPLGRERLEAKGSITKSMCPKIL